MDTEAVRQQMPAPQRLRIFDHLVEIEPDGGVVRCDDRARADADNGVERHAVAHELPQDPRMCSAAQSPSAQHDADTHIVTRPRVHSSIRRPRGNECNHSRKRYLRIYESTNLRTGNP